MRYNRKTIYIGIIKAIAFLLVFLMLFHAVTDLFRTKTSYFAIRPIYDLPKNSVDVLLLGTSHMNNTISPMDLWNSYGITSFNAAVGQQSLPTTYFELRELLRRQKPRVVVLETYYISRREAIVGNEKTLHWLVDNVPFSLGVSEAIQTLISEDHGKGQYYLNFFSFHNRWKQLSKEDFKPNSGYNRGANTGRYNMHDMIEYPYIVPRTETVKPPDRPLEYLDKIIQLCRENEIQLVLMAQAFHGTSNRQRKMNYVDVIAEREGLPYVNFFYLIEEIGLDFATDMADWGHVNYFGAKKFTSYLGEYLQTNYQLEDHRNDPKIADLWNKDYQAFTRGLNNTMMKTAENLDEYFNYLQNQDYILAWNAYSETPLSETYLPNCLETMGIDPSGIKEENRYYAVTRGDRPLYQKSPGKKTNDTYMAEDTLFSFGSGITGSSNAIGVHVGRTECSVGTTGLNLVVYDPISRMVVDKANIDLDTGDIRRK